MTKDSSWLVKVAGVAALLGIIGGGVAVLLLLLLPIILIVIHGWPWFHAEPSMILPEPSGHTTLFWVSLALLGLSLGIRLTRRIGRNLSVMRVVVMVVLGTIGWYIHAHTALGTASYFIFRWLVDLGWVVSVIYAVSSFFGGLAPGFLGAQSIFLYLVYHDPRIILVSVLPAVIGEVLDSLVGDIRESGEEPDATPDDTKD